MRLWCRDASTSLKLQRYHVQARTSQFPCFRVPVQRLQRYHVQARTQYLPGWVNRIIELQRYHVQARTHPAVLLRFQHQRLQRYHVQARTSKTELACDLAVGCNATMFKRELGARRYKGISGKRCNATMFKREQAWPCQQYLTKVVLQRYHVQARTSVTLPTVLNQGGVATLLCSSKNRCANVQDRIDTLSCNATMSKQELIQLYHIPTSMSN